MADLNQTDINELTKALQSTLIRTESQFTALENKIESLRRELAQAQQDLRRELASSFVTRAEYDPRHRTIEDKMVAFDRHVAEQAPLVERLIRVEAAADQNRRSIDLSQTAIEEVEDRQRDALSRAVPWRSKATILSSIVLCLGSYSALVTN